MTDVRIVPFDDSHDVSKFESGEDSRDRWLRQHAFANQVAHSSRTFVVLEPESPQVWGYYSLTVATIQRAEVTTPAKHFKTPGDKLKPVEQRRRTRFGSSPATRSGGRKAMAT